MDESAETFSNFLCPDLPEGEWTFCMFVWICFTKKAYPKPEVFVVKSKVFVQVFVRSRLPLIVQYLSLVQDPYLSYVEYTDISNLLTNNY